MVDASLILQGAVAVGTLSLAGASYYQARLLVHERNATRAREMAEKIYTPLGQQIWGWPDTQLPEVSSWNHFKSSMPYLTQKVPKEISTLLEQRDQILEEMSRLQEKIREQCKSRIVELGWQLALAKGQQTTLEKTTAFQVNCEVLRVEQNNLPSIWLSCKDLYTWISDYRSEHLPDQEWRIDVVVGGSKFGGLEDAKTVAATLFKELEDLPYAQRFRELSKKARAIGASLTQLTEKELAKTAKIDQ